MQTQTHEIQLPNRTPQPHNRIIQLRINTVFVTLCRCNRTSCYQRNFHLKPDGILPLFIIKIQKQSPRRMILGDSTRQSKCLRIFRKILGVPNRTICTGIYENNKIEITFNAVMFLFAPSAFRVLEFYITSHFKLFLLLVYANCASV